MEQFKQGSSAQDLEQLRASYNRLLEEQKGKVKEAERLLEKELLTKYQTLEEELKANDKVREIDTEKFKREFEARLDNERREARIREVALDRDREAYESATRSKYERLLEETRSEMKQARDKLTEEETRLYAKYEQIALEQARKVADENKARSDLMRQTAQLSQAETDLAQRTDQLDSEFAEKHARAVEELAQIERDLQVDKNKYKRDLEQRFEDQLQRVREHERIVEDERAKFTEKLHERCEKSLEQDRVVIQRQQERLADFEDELFDRFQQMVEDHKSRLAALMEEGTSKKIQLAQAAMESEAKRVEEIKAVQRLVDEQITNMLSGVRKELDLISQIRDSEKSELGQLRAKLLHQQSEGQRQLDELSVAKERELSELRASTNRELSEKQHSLLLLKEQTIGQEREAKIRRERTQREIETEIKALYDDIHRETEKKQAEDAMDKRRRQNEKDIRERMEFEAAVRGKYEIMLTETETETDVRNQCNKMITEHEEKTRVARQDVDKARAKELKIMMQARAQLEEDMEQSRKSFESEIRDKYETVLQGHKKQIIRCYASGRNQASPSGRKTRICPSNARSTRNRFEPSTSQ